VEAPTAGSVMLAGVLLKMGTYGLLRFCLPLFPYAARELASAISVLAVIGIIYGGLVAMVQPNLKKLIAYTSVSHLGFVVLGIFSFHQTAVEGAVYQMINHGITTGALFLLVGMIYERRHSHLIRDMGGLATPAPALAVLFMIAALSSLGLPLLNNFVGEFLILLGVWQVRSLYAVLAAAGVVLAVIYMLWMYQRVFLGEVRPENRNMPDLDRLEKGILIPAVVLMLLLGVCSPFFLRKMDASTMAILERVGGSEIHVQDDSPANRQRQAARLMAPRNPASSLLPKNERSGETVSGIAY
ncbi:MAG: NADH-quinone oxidoreductase subunit M, partial [Acidobacteria bacterium]|nr:NADH-quinone oxidoreductase subunit M [Acidobacteriota bacterium]